MSDSYQAIYDATRSKIDYCDAGQAIRYAIESQLDLSVAQSRILEAIGMVTNELQRPSVVYRPRVYADGDMWCALYGDNMQSGVCGFGKTPSEACDEFDKAWWRSSPPPCDRSGNSAIASATGGAG